MKNEELNFAAETLEFPIPPAGYPLRPVTIEFQTMLLRIEENMPWRNARPGEEARRLAEKIPVAFVL